MGAYVSMSLMKVPDLSIESAYAMGAICAAKCLLVGTGLPNSILLVLVIVASMLAGLVVGALSSSLTRFAGIPHLLSSILTIGLFHGIKQLVLGVSNLSLGALQNPLLSCAFVQKSPELGVLLCITIVLVIIGFLFLKTQLGYAIGVYGNNPRFFENYRISSNYIFCMGIMISNALAGLSGYLVAQSSGFVDTNAELGMALFCITALILGKTMVRSKKFISIMIPCVGVIVYCTLQQLLLKVGFNLKYFTMIQSIIVLLLLIYTYRKNRSSGQITDNLGV